MNRGQPTEPARADFHSELQRLKHQGGDRFDPAGFCFLQTLADRHQALVYPASKAVERGLRIALQAFWLGYT